MYDYGSLSATTALVGLISLVISLIILFWFVGVMNAINRNTREIASKMDQALSMLQQAHNISIPPAPSATPSAQSSAPASGYKCWKCSAPVAHGSETCASCGAKLIWPK